MRHLALACLAVASLLFASAAQAQQTPPLRLRIEKVKLGFQGTAQEDPAGTFKPGLWVPVHVTLVRAGDGPIILPIAKDGTVRGEVRVETTDSDGIPNVYSEPFKVRAQERLNLLTYTKPAATGPEIRVTVHPGDRADGDDRGPQNYSARPDHFLALELHEHLYLTLGARLPDLQKALVAMAGNPEDKRTAPRHLTHESEVHRLPARWFGYNAVDLAVLTTDNKTFLQELLKTENRPRVEALAAWVRRGGRLVVSVSWVNQDLVHKLLTDADAWQPPLPDVLPADGKAEVKTLHGVQNWAAVDNKPFFRPGDKALRIAKLRSPDTVEVRAKEEDGSLMIVRTPYGLGSVTFFAFDVDKAPFTLWKGIPEFWKETLTRLAPKVMKRDPQQEMRFGEQWVGNDLTSRLHQELDRFDTPPISFGWVALFILIYILVVGPLDYLLLKKVFKRLELTWITFPAVVLTISLVAYFTAYAVKGKDLKVNKLDLVEIDLRTDLDKDLRTREAQAYGTTWFTILSPQIKSYTIGIEPVFPRQAGGVAAKDTPLALVTWLGRPEAGGMGGIGRPRSQGLFTRTYAYARDGAGLRDVPIPVWTTKSFTATWNASLKTLPFKASLHYDPDDADRKLSGTILNNMPLDLQEVALFYGRNVYRLSDCLKGQELRLADLGNPLAVQQWANPGGKNLVPGDPEAFAPDGMLYDPGQILKELLFHEKMGTVQTLNHSQRPLDQSWRLPEEWALQPAVVREAILVGRLPRARGSAESLTADNDPRLPTHLWLEALPLPGGEKQERPSLSGSVVQDTYLRIFLPVTPAKR